MLSEERELVARLVGVKKIFTSHGHSVAALDGVDLQIQTGQTVGVVGESGCGKSTLGRLVAGLDRPTKGKVTYGQGGRSKPGPGSIQMVFQDPGASLNPRMPVGHSVSEAFRRNRPDQDRETVPSLLEQVGLEPKMSRRLPGQLSGGQQQRVAIARSIAGEPKLVVHDESLTALDVSLQAQVINLLLDLQERMGVGYLFISHDLRAVRAMSDHVVVMYLGRIVEEAPVEAFRQGDLLHPYSVLLREAEPSIDGAGKEARIHGEINAPPGVGCRFAPRCPLADDHCRAVDPTLEPADGIHRAACHKPGQLQ